MVILKQKEEKRQGKEGQGDKEQTVTAVKIGVV
jgi:hypothetical protein